MKNTYYFLVCTLLIISCSKSDDDQFQDPEILLTEINSISKSVVCEDPSEWEIIRFGSSSCGFTSHTRAFHSSINREELQNKLDAYKEAEKRRRDNQFGEIACLSIAPRNILITNTQFVECISGESKISIDTQFENKFLLGKWKLSFSRQRNGETIEDGDKILAFNEVGYNFEGLNCQGTGVYGLEEGNVVLSSSNCNIDARIFVSEFETSSLELLYDCEKDTDVCFEIYTKVVE